jgi:site-specific recombinase XerD
MNGPALLSPNAFRQRASRGAGRPKISKRVNRSGSISWCVDLGTVNGVRQRQFFKSKQEAENKADLLKIARTNLGAAAFALTDKQRVDATEALGLLAPVNATLVQACRYYLKHAKPPRPILVKDLVTAFLAAKKQAGRRPIYLKNLAYILNACVRQFGERQANDLGHEEIELWIRSLPLSLRSQAHYCADLSNLFSYAIKQNHCASNPIDRLERPRGEEKTIGILTVEQAGRLLDVARDESRRGMLPFVVLGLFCGLRREELLRLDWKCVNLQEHFVEVTAAASKTRQRRIVRLTHSLPNGERGVTVIYKPALDWLSKMKCPKSGPIAPKDAPYQLERLAGLAGIEPYPRNALRHSFASYLLALTQNAALVAEQLGHAGFESLYRNYRQLVTPKNAAAYWMMSSKISTKRGTFRST